MLEIEVSVAEEYDEETKEFRVSESFRVELEHSLYSMSKWESLWEIPFLGKEEKTSEQVLSYIKMMIMGKQPPPEIFLKLVEDHLGQIKNYIEAKMTATTIHERPGNSSYQETITSELIYYWMVSMKIPAEYQHWHLNRLITLIRVINVKNTPNKKMSAAERRNLNRQRLTQNRTRG